LDIERIVADLKKQREQITQAIAALEGLSPSASSRNGASFRSGSYRVAAQGRRKGSHISPEGRKRLSELMRKRWAERRKKQHSKA
jgi:hypothetical protein